MTPKITSNISGRRRFLRASGVVCALPFLESVKPLFAGPASLAPDLTRAPKRFIGICNNLGFLPDRFFPSFEEGAYQASPYLEQFSELEGRFTVLDGVSHPGVNGSHRSDVCFLTAAPGPGTGSFRNTISFDQYLAGQFGSETRFPSMTLGVNAKPGERSLSWTQSGVLIPCTSIAADVYRSLFLKGSDAEIEAKVNDLRLGRSMMDFLMGASNRLKRDISKRDKERLDQYQTAIRDVEKRLNENEAWARKPKPVAPIPEPTDPEDRGAFNDKTRLMLQMAKLAFETDSTRSISLLLDANGTPAISDLEEHHVQVDQSYHNLSHHGKRDNKLSQLEAIDNAQLRELRDFLNDLSAVDEGDGDLLENTTVMYGSNLGDANKHTTTNMPMLVAGGRFKHQNLLQFDRKDNYPLPNIFVSILQQMGLEADAFSTGKSTLTGLDIRGA
ncbi:MAG: DUF1552 domain-containing protein [Opitutales bacterium]